jgi:hypothetical protein
MRALLKIPYKNPETDRIVFETWFSEGSLKKAQLKLRDDGIVNAWGRPFATPDSVRKAAIRYMVSNYEESKKMLIDTYEKNGYYVEEDFIERYMIRLAVSNLRTPERVKFWLLEHDLLEKHKKYIGSLIAV